MKKLKKLSSLIVALTLILSPLQIQAQTGTGNWGISSAYSKRIV